MEQYAMSQILPTSRTQSITRKYHDHTLSERISKLGPSDACKFATHSTSRHDDPSLPVYSFCKISAPHLRCIAMSCVSSYGPYWRPSSPSTFTFPALERLALYYIPDCPSALSRLCVTQLLHLTHLAVLDPSQASDAPQLSCLTDSDGPFLLPHLTTLATRGPSPHAIRSILEAEVLSSRRLQVYMHLDGLAMPPTATEGDFVQLDKCISWMRENRHLGNFYKPTLGLCRTWESLERRDWQDHSQRPVGLSEEDLMATLTH